MTTARLGLLLWFTWATFTTGLLLWRPTPALTDEDRLKIYAAVIVDFRGPIDIGHPPRLPLLDPEVLEPVDVRLESEGLQEGGVQPQTIIQGLRRLTLIRGACEPSGVQVSDTCVGDLPGPVYALSSIQVTQSNTVIVSILMRTARTTHQKFYIPFAVEYQYELEPQWNTWTVTKKHETMIT